MAPNGMLAAVVASTLALGCGAHVRLSGPGNSIVAYDVTWQSQTEALDILTADDLHIKTAVTVTDRPNKEDLYRLQLEIGPAYYQRVIGPAFITLARSEFAKHAHNDLAKAGPRIEAQVLSELRQAIAGKPIEIDRIAIKHIEYDEGVTKAITAKLATQQRMEQKEFELKIAEKDADIVRITAKGNSDARRIEAEGDAAATVLQGRAQAQAQSEITRTLTLAYLRYEAFDSDATRYYFVPTGKDGMPIIVNTDGGAEHAPFMNRGAKPLGRTPTTR